MCGAFNKMETKTFSFCGHKATCIKEMKINPITIGWAIWVVVAVKNGSTINIFVWDDYLTDDNCAKFPCGIVGDLLRSCSITTEYMVTVPLSLSTHGWLQVGSLHIIYFEICPLLNKVPQNTLQRRQCFLKYPTFKKKG